MESAIEGLGDRGATTTTTSWEVLYLGWKLLQCLGSLEVLLGIGPKLDRHVDGIFFGEPLSDRGADSPLPKQLQKGWH